LLKDKHPGTLARVVRRRIVLSVVQWGEGADLAIPSHASEQVIYRGAGDADYVCGCCGHLLAVGVREGMFPAVVLPCGCGALNRVPHGLSRAASAPA